jgi:hypothetical protein
MKTASPHCRRRAPLRFKHWADQAHTHLSTKSDPGRQAGLDDGQSDEKAESSAADVSCKLLSYE